LSENAYFHQDDPQASEVMGYPIPPEWWSRVYEYPWAMQYAEPGHVVADMGAGWQYRPFRDMLAVVCGKVYAVDWGTGLLDQPKPDNVEFVIDGLTHRIEAIPAGSLDRVFCISVLEELDGDIPLALGEFYTCLKPGGLCVLTLDVQYDMDKPLPSFPGVDIEQFFGYIFGLQDWSIRRCHRDKTGAVVHDGLNLCVYHCVLEKP